MSKLKNQVILLAMVIGFVSHASAATVNFENLYPSLSKTTTNAMPNNYAGVNWSSSFRLMTREYSTTGLGYKNGMSGNVVAYTSGAAGANAVEMSSSETFNFTGAYITSAWKMNQDVLLQGYYNQQLIYETTIITSSDHAYWFDFDFKDINRLRIVPGTNGTNIYNDYRGNHLAIDNVTTIPEPATLLLLGLGGLIVRKRHFSLHGK